MQVFQQMLIFFLLMLLGIYARRKGIINEANMSQISALAVNVAYPAIILSSVAGGGTRIEGAELLSAVGVALLVLVAAVVLGLLVPRLLGFSKSERGMANAMVVFTNIGFMGLPMIQGIYGSDALIYMTVFLIPFNVLFYAYAIPTIQADGAAKRRFRLRDLLNVGMGACVLSVIVYFSGIRLPYVLSTTVQMIGSLTAPLAMMLIGASLPDIPWRAALTNLRIWAFVALKMLILPVVVLLAIAHFVPVTPVLLAVGLCALATPSGNMLAALANLYNKESVPLATETIALTTAVSVFTMPLVAFFAGI